MSAVAVTTVSLPVNRRGVARNVGPDSPFDRWGNCATHNRREYDGATAKDIERKSGRLPQRRRLSPACPEPELHQRQAVYTLGLPCDVSFTSLGSSPCGSAFPKASPGAPEARVRPHVDRRISGRDDEAGDAPFAQSVTDHERELDARVLFAQAGAQAGVS
jgi:hypothetical protein